MNKKHRNKYRVRVTVHTATGLHRTTRLVETTPVVKFNDVQDAIDYMADKLNVVKGYCSTGDRVKVELLDYQYEVKERRDWQASDVVRCGKIKEPVRRYVRETTQVRGKY